MTYDIKNLNVASLDFDDIRTNLATFLNAQPDMADIDFDSPSTAASMILNILATATAYNGIYAQMAYINSWPSSSNMTQAVLSAASLSSVVIPYIKSASANLTLEVGGSNTGGVPAYTAFYATGTNGSSLIFYNTTQIPYSTSTVVTLYCGTNVTSYTNYDYVSQSIELPNTIDPDTISMTVIKNSDSTTTDWTRVEKGSDVSSSNKNVFCVLNSTNGYRVTNLLPNANSITTSYRVLVKAITSNGVAGNGAAITIPSNITANIIGSAVGGYDALTLKQAQAKFNFNYGGYKRCVTLQDYKNAIVASGISGTEDPTLVTVANSSIPATVNVYVSGLSSSNQTALLSYLSNLSVAGISVAYTL
jgi:hypothetical protein